MHLRGLFETLFKSRESCWTGAVPEPCPSPGELADSPLCTGVVQTLFYELSSPEGPEMVSPSQRCRDGFQAVQVSLSKPGGVTNMCKPAEVRIGLCILFAL